MNNKLKGLLHNHWLELAARWVLGGIFVVASYHKITEPALFAKIIYGYALFPNYSINVIAIFLPFLELTSGMALLLGIYPRSAALIANLMLLAFITAVSFNIIRGHEFDCGCFSLGNAGHTSSAFQLLIRDIIYVCIGFYLLFFNIKRKWCIRQSGSIFKNLFTFETP